MLPGFGTDSPTMRYVEKRLGGSIEGSDIMCWDDFNEEGEEQRGENEDMLQRDAHLSFSCSKDSERTDPLNSEGYKGDVSENTAVKGDRNLIFSLGLEDAEDNANVDGTVKKKENDIRPSLEEKLDDSDPAVRSPSRRATLADLGARISRS